jgi:hypothetical protein
MTPYTPKPCPMNPNAPAPYYSHYQIVTSSHYQNVTYPLNQITPSTPSTSSTSHTTIHRATVTLITGLTFLPVSAL